MENAKSLMMGATGATGGTAINHDSTEPKANNPKESTSSYVEHHVPREEGTVYARDYKGTGPAFVLMHGFPDNLHIWDDLIPYLVASGRRVVTFDFLGFGASDKSAGDDYRFYLSESLTKSVQQSCCCCEGHAASRSTICWMALSAR